MLRVSVRGMAVVFALNLVVAACGDDSATSTTSAPEAQDQVVDHEAAPHWAYEGPEGPDHWADLDAAFAACEAGMEQSPVDLVAAAQEDLPDPILSWSTSDLDLVNNGHTMQANVPPGNTTDFGGETYDLIQFHWHRPSEHTVAGDPFAMELHFVHANATGDLAVLGVLIEVGAANPLYDRLWSFQPGEDGHALVASVELTQLLPSNLRTYVYPGSLTTPPCSEGVAWNVLAAPATMSAEQVDGFLYEGNARPVLPIGDRTITLDSD